MVGNSLKSDIAPPVALGSFGAHIPYAFTWAHEQVPQTRTPESTATINEAQRSAQQRTFTLATILEVPALVAQLEAR
jgi:hypothetical protein